MYSLVAFKLITSYYFPKIATYIYKKAFDLIIIPVWHLHRQSFCMTLILLFFLLCPASSAIPCGFVTRLHFSTAGLTLQGCRAIGLPHHSILTAHRTPTSLLLRLVAVDISNTDPAARRPTSSAAAADTDGPLRVVLCSLECDALAWGNEIYVEDFPAWRAVRVQDSRGATPELNQQVGLKRRCNPGVIQVWLWMKQWKSLHYFLFFIKCIYCKKLFFWICK